MNKISTSKLLLLFVCLSYFVGLIYGMIQIDKIIISYSEYAVQALIAFFSYIGSATCIGFGFYSWKAKFEKTLQYGDNGSQVIPLEGEQNDI